MPENIIYRSATETDIPGISRLYEAIPNIDRALTIPEHLRTLLEDGLQRIQVAEKDENVIGVVIFSAPKIFPPHVKSVVIDSNSRGMGIGIGLLATAEHILKEQGHRVVTLVPYNPEGDIDLHLWYSNRGYGPTIDGDTWIKKL